MARTRGQSPLGLRTSRWSQQHAAMAIQRQIEIDFPSDTRRKRSQQSLHRVDSEILGIFSRPSGAHSNSFSRRNVIHPTNPYTVFKPFIWGRSSRKLRGSVVGEIIYHIKNSRETFESRPPECEQSVSSRSQHMSSVF
jgi:hypothetical protein